MSTTDTDSSTRARGTTARPTPGVPGGTGTRVISARPAPSSPPPPSRRRCPAPSAVRGPGALGWLTWTGREVIGWVRWFWRQLTSMRVALLLLFLLSLGAIPGSLIPQSGTDETKVAGVQGRAQPCSVRSTTSSACSTSTARCGSRRSTSCCSSRSSAASCPRTWQFVGQLRGRPPGAPRRLTRLPAYTTWRTEAEPEQVREAALDVLKQAPLPRARRRGRRRRGEGLSARDRQPALPHRADRDAGRLRLGPALQVRGQQADRRGRRLLQHARCSTTTSSPAPSSAHDDLTPFSFDLKKFTGTYERTGPNKGTPRTLPGGHRLQRSAPTARSRRPLVKVNEPLRDRRLEGLPHRATATRPSSPSATARATSSSTTPCRCCRSTRTSPRRARSRSWTATRTRKGRSDQLGFSGRLRADLRGRGQAATMFSQFPALDYPVLT